MVMIARDRGNVAGTKRLHALIGERAVAHHVSAADDLVNIIAIELFEDCVESVKVAVDVRYDADALQLLRQFRTRLVLSSSHNLSRSVFSILSRRSS